MSFDKTEVIVQTLQGQIDVARKRAASASKDISEHEGASLICGQLAKKALSYDKMIEDRLQAEILDNSCSEEMAQKIRVYTKNLIMRLHALCDNNQLDQKNQVLITKGRMDEALKMIRSLEGEIAKHENFAKQRAEQEDEEGIEDKFDNSDIDEEEDIDGEADTKPGKRERNKLVSLPFMTPPPLPDPPTPVAKSKPIEEPDPDPDPEPDPEPIPEPIDDEASYPIKKPDRRILSRGRKKK